MIGKTGSGKTTVSALVAMTAASRGHRALAVDTDTSPNLGLSLGLPQAALDLELGIGALRDAVSGIVDSFV